MHSFSHVRRSEKTLSQSVRAPDWQNSQKTMTIIPVLQIQPTVVAGKAVNNCN